MRRPRPTRISSISSLSSAGLTTQAKSFANRFKVPHGGATRTLHRARYPQGRREPHVRQRGDYRANESILWLAHEQDDRSQHVKGGAQAQRGERARALATALDDGGADGAQARRAQGVRRALHPRPDRQRNGNRIPKNTPTFARCSVRWECFRQKGKRYQTRFLGVEAGSGIEPLYEDLQSSA